MKKAVNILMTCTGGDLAPEYIMAMKGSERYDVTLIAVDGNANAIGRSFADYFHVVPMGGAAGYIDAILTLVKKYGINLIIAGSDGEALSLSVSKDLFDREGCVISCPSPEILSALSNKAATYRKLKDAGVPCADFLEISDLGSLQDAVADFYGRYKEVVIKPAISRGGRNVFVIRSDIQGEQSYHGGRETHCSLDIFQKKYQKSVGDLFPVVVMQRLFEPTYDIDVLSWNGQAINVVPRLRHNPAGIPFEGNTISMTDNLTSLGRKVCEIFNLSWLLDVDVMCTKDGTPVVLEVNPRMSGSCPATVKAGVPLFDNIMALALGDRPDEVVPEDGTVIVGYKALRKVGA